MSSKPRSLGVQAHMMLFVLLAALGAAALGALGLLQNRSSRALTDQLLADVHLARAAALVDMVHDGLLATTRAAELAGPQADAAAQADVRAELAGMQQTLASAQALLLRGATEPAVRQADADLRPLIDRYARDAALLVEAALGGSADVPQLSRAVAADFKTLEPALAALSDLIEQQAGRRLVQRDALFADQRAWMLGVASVMVVGLVVVGRWFARSLLARLGAEPPLLGRLTQDIADGVLYSPLPGPPPAAGSVAAALLTMRDRLAETVAVIRDGADSVAIGSTQIAVGNHDLAERTARQAGSLQTAAQGMAGVTALLQQTATHAQSASALAAQSSVAAQRSGEAVQCLATTMTGIEAAGRLIAEISARIDGIATQTNILALNAAVEASRAGEQGQGFVAVAGEVRRLAQHTAAAAREIKGLVATSLAQLAEGSRQATDAGSRLAETMAQVDDVATLITAISRAAQAQSADMDQVGGSVSLLDQATQQNAALVEESAAAAAQLRDQAVRLADSVAVFRLRSAV